MKERPIIFSGPMVRAILESRKTQTRRTVKGIALEWLAPDMFTPRLVADPDNSLCPYGQPGTTLWVRECFGYVGSTPHEGVAYRATDVEWNTVDGFKWRPSIHMPRSASRILLEISGIRVERLQDISEEDAKAEGVMNLFNEHHVCFDANDWLNYTWHGIGGNDSFSGYSSTKTAKDSFQSLWYKINGPESWNENPWVWVIEFKTI